MDYKVFVVFVHLGFGLTSCFHLKLREYHYIDQPMSWADARDYCREKHTDLVTIRGMDDISKLNKSGMDPTFVWIGLSDDPQSWKGTMGRKSNSWRWSATGKRRTTRYHNWYLGQPNNKDANELCVRLGPFGKWNDKSCLSEFKCICYNDKNPPGQKTYILSDEKMTWADAQDYCQTRHTDLAVIESAEENKEAASVKGMHEVWIGLHRVSWMWSDKSKSSFTNWKSGQPDNFFGNQFCVAEDSDHLWSDWSCDEKYPFFCQQDQKTSKTVVRMKIQTHADLSDPATSSQILQQLTAALAKNGLTDIRLTWNIPPRKAETVNY